MAQITKEVMENMQKKQSANAEFQVYLTERNYEYIEEQIIKKGLCMSVDKYMTHLINNVVDKERMHV